MSSYLGQNFLTDDTILYAIAEQVQQLFDLTNASTLIEVGPGKGALTQLIQNIASQTLLIEYDEKMINYLKNHHILSQNTQIIHKDILQRDETNTNDFPYQTAQYQTLVVGNLPYYITSPILRKFFETQQETRAGGIFLIQKEAADKIIHNASKKSFLRWLLNYAHKVEHCFNVPPTAFTPPPKVTSTVIRIIPKSPSEIPNLDYNSLLQLLDQISGFKRKTLGKIWKMTERTNLPTSLIGKRLEELDRDEIKLLIQ